MILSDTDIEAALHLKDIFISPYDEKFLQPASYDLHLGNEFIFFNQDESELDLKQPLESRMVGQHIFDHESLLLEPGQFVLGVTKETIGVKGNLAARMDGKSSLGRVGLFIHITAGFIDPGNKLNLTLELLNVSGKKLRIYPGMPIAQVSFHYLHSDVRQLYGDDRLNSKYYGATKPQVSQFYKNFI